MRFPPLAALALLCVAGLGAGLGAGLAARTAVPDTPAAAPPADAVVWDAAGDADALTLGDLPPSDAHRIELPVTNRSAEPVRVTLSAGCGCTGLSPRGEFTLSPGTTRTVAASLDLRKGVSDPDDPTRWTFTETLTAQARSFADRAAPRRVDLTVTAAVLRPFTVEGGPSDPVDLVGGRTPEPITFRVRLHDPFEAVRVAPTAEFPTVTAEEISPWEGLWEVTATPRGRADGVVEDVRAAVPVTGVAGDGREAALPVAVDLAYDRPVRAEPAELDFGLLAPGEHREWHVTLHGVPEGATCSGETANGAVGVRRLDGETVSVTLTPTRNGRGAGAIRVRSTSGETLLTVPLRWYVTGGTDARSSTRELAAGDGR